MAYRTTIARRISIEGIGLHSGCQTRLTLQPAPPGTGVVFVRTDLDGRQIPASLASLTRAAYATKLAADGASVSTVEHLLSAVAGLGIDDLVVELDAEEVPILDGSATPFVSMLADAGRSESDEVRQVIQVERPLILRDGEKMVRLDPARQLRIDYAIDFDHPVIGSSRKTYTPRPRSYAREIAPARTFCRMEEVDALRQAGLARGGSLENALVVGDQGLLNGPLRFADEFVRHKILDLMGDLVLLGAPLAAQVTAVCAGHAMHTELVRMLLVTPDAWRLAPAMPVVESPAPRPVAAALA